VAGRRRVGRDEARKIVRDLGQLGLDVPLLQVAGPVVVGQDSRRGHHERRVLRGDVARIVHSHRTEVGAGEDDRGQQDEEQPGGGQQ
jgi:hypothetical protein